MEARSTSGMPKLISNSSAFIAKLFVDSATLFFSAEPTKNNSIQNNCLENHFSFLFLRKSNKKKETCECKCRSCGGKKSKHKLKKGGQVRKTKRGNCGSTDEGEKGFLNFKCSLSRWDGDSMCRKLFKLCVLIPPPAEM